MLKDTSPNTLYPAGAVVVDQPTHVADPVVDQPREERAATKPRRPKAPTNYNSLEYRIGRSLAAVASLGLAACLWYAGAFFTLETTTDVFPITKQLGLWLWIIPAAITLIEIYQWPTRPQSGWLSRSIWGVVCLIDIGTSCAGLVRWAAGRSFDLFTTITLPTEGPALIVLGTIVGTIFAFVPERIAREMIYNLQDFIKAVIKRFSR